jgi:general secretion pathway protein H
MAGAGVVMSMRTTGEQQLAREAQRLVAMLDAALAQSRATGVAVVWRPDGAGFSFAGLQPAQPEPTPWLEPGTTVRGAKALVLGPEPIIERQQIELALGDQTLRIGTDGLRPFSVESADAPVGELP